MKKLPTIIVVFLLLALLLVSGCARENNKTGDDFSFITITGEMRRLSDFSGKVVVLDCMAVNCEPCLYEMFELKKVSENYSRSDVAILSIDVWVSNGENRTLLQRLIRDFKSQVNITLDWTFGLDDPEGTIEHAYAPQGVPSLYIYDKKGNIYYSHVGYEDYSMLASKIDEALRKN